MLVYLGQPCSSRYCAAGRYFLSPRIQFSGEAWDGILPKDTWISVEVVSKPQNDVQSFTRRPAPSTSLPRLTVPATMGTLKSVLRRIHRLETTLPAIEKIIRLLLARRTEDARSLLYLKIYRSYQQGHYQQHSTSY